MENGKQQNIRRGEKKHTQYPSTTAHRLICFLYFYNRLLWPYLAAGFWFSAVSISISEQGYAFPPDSFWVGDTPLLQFLLRCGLVKQKIQGNSMDDIYTKSDITEGIKQLQTILGLEKTGKETPDVQKIVKKNKCPYNTRRNKPTFKHVQASLARFLKSPIIHLNKLLNNLKKNLKNPL